MTKDQKGLPRKKNTQTSFHSMITTSQTRLLRDIRILMIPAYQGIHQPLSVSLDEYPQRRSNPQFFPHCPR